MDRKAILFASIFSIFIGFLVSLNFYYFTTGQIEDARSIFEAGGGDPKNFNSIFWICNKIFSSMH
jgi:hypothetical protein